MLDFPKNIWILTITTALASTAAPFFILVGGLMGAELAPNEKWATLPIACVVLGSASMMVPSIFLMKKWGRKLGSYFGLGLSITSALICALASYYSHFLLLLLGSITLGAGAAFIQQFRFAAIESVASAKDIAPALCLLLLGGAVAAVVGPEMASRGRFLFGPEQTYTGSFLLLALVNILALVVFSFFSNPSVQVESTKLQQRPLLNIIRQPVFITAAASAAVGFAVMSFLMTSTPVTMHHIYGHSVDDAKWVIQSHMLAMFLPSLFTGALIKRFGIGIIIFTGALLFTVVLAIASQGHQVLHFWWALVLLGIGWNFLFIGGTTLLPQAYNHNERFKIQAVNDAIVFSMQATASLSAGWVLFRYGWSMQLIICIPFVAIAFALPLVLIFSKNQVAK